MFEGEDDLIFPKANIQMRVNLRDMQVCIFEVEHPEIQVPFLDKNRIGSVETLRTYSFLFGAQDLNEDRAAMFVYNGFENKFAAKMTRFRSNLLANFVDTANKILKRKNYSLIYFGERNEG
jgi:hypothetical protein